jgi:hypothetical protein
MTQVKQQLNEATYDIEINHRIGAHLIYKQLQADAKQASQSSTVEGFPKDASTAFIKCILKSSSENQSKIQTQEDTWFGAISPIPTFLAKSS